MPRTRILFAAYDSDMDVMILIFLLALSGKNADELKRSLSSALSFYRDNRELIAALMKKQEPVPRTKQGEQPPEQTESRPQAVGDYTILEEFLKANPV